jgi:WG containing repeat
MKANLFKTIFAMLILSLAFVGGMNYAEGQSGDELSGHWKGEFKAIPPAIFSTCNCNTIDSVADFTREPDGRYTWVAYPDCKLQKTGPHQYRCEYAFEDLNYKVTVEIQNGQLTMREEEIFRGDPNTLNVTVFTGTKLQSKASSSDFGDCSPTLNSSDTPNPRAWNSVKPFSVGLAAVGAIPRGGQSAKWGFVDRTGQVVIPLRYDVVTPFNGGLAGVGIITRIEINPPYNARWRVINKRGQIVGENRPDGWDAVKILGEGFAAVGFKVSGLQSLQWNLINSQGVTLARNYEYFDCFVGGRARAMYADRYYMSSATYHVGYVGSTGRFIEDNNRR